nr:hypothetical protein [Streptomyces sp. WAC05458]
MERTPQVGEPGVRPRCQFDLHQPRRPPDRRQRSAVTKRLSDAAVSGDAPRPCPRCAVHRQRVGAPAAEADHPSQSRRPAGRDAFSGLSASGILLPPAITIPDRHGRAGGGIRAVRGRAVTG